MTRAYIPHDCVHPPTPLDITTYICRTRLAARGHPYSSPSKGQPSNTPLSASRAERAIPPVRAPPSRRGGGTADASRSAVGHPPAGWARSPSHSSASFLESSSSNFDRARPHIPSASARAARYTGRLKPGFECRRRDVSTSIVCRRDDADVDPPTNRSCTSSLVAGGDGDWDKSTAQFAMRQLVCATCIQSSENGGRAATRSRRPPSRNARSAD